jgi:hypothetical protein
MRFTGLMVAAALPFGVVACSSPAPTKPVEDAAISDALAADDDLVDCSGDADTYAAKLQKPGDHHIFQFTLVSATPAPPNKGENTWIIEVQDANGAPVQGLTVSVDAYMPQHNHGSPETPVVMPQPDGTFQASHIFLFMTGYWRITITATTQDGKKSDSAEYYFCIA